MDSLFHRSHRVRSAEHCGRRHRGGAQVRSELTGNQRDDHGSSNFGFRFAAAVFFGAGDHLCGISAAARGHRNLWGDELHGESAHAGNWTAYGAGSATGFRATYDSRADTQVDVAGSWLGLAGAFVVARFLTSMLFGVGVYDPVTFVGVAALLIAVALAASYIPARRAMRVDPIVALRYE